MIILEICQKQPFGIIAMTPRGTLELCCVHMAQLMIHPAVYTLTFTLQLCYKPLGILQRVNKSQKVHISSDVLKKLHNIDFVSHKSWGFLIEGVEKQELTTFPINIFEENQKPFSWNLSLYTILNEEQGGSCFSHTKIHCGHFCCNKNLQILWSALTSW